MDRVGLKIETAGKALVTLKELVPPENFSIIIRDAAIQRFEYSFEACWKAAKAYLQTVEGVKCASPKSVIRASLQAGLLKEIDCSVALSMVDDRNMTAHTYHEGVAQGIYERLEKYVEIMEKWVEKMRLELSANF